MAQVESGEGVKHEPNVVPMIDIMLVLLIIFMIVTPVIAAGFEARMPQGKNLSTATDEGGDVVLGIDKDGNYFLDPGTGRISPVCPPNRTGCVQRDELQKYLTEIYTNRATDKRLYFKADQNLEYGTVEGAVQIARSAGVRVLAAVTEEKREGALLGRRR